MFKKMMTANGQESIANPKAGQVGEPDRISIWRAYGEPNFQEGQKVTEHRLPNDAVTEVVSYVPLTNEQVLAANISKLDQIYRSAAYGQAEVHGFDQITLMAIQQNRDDGLLNTAQIARHDAIKNFARAVWGIPGLAGAYYTRKDELRAGTLDVESIDVMAEHPWTLGDTEEFWKLV